jgi:hypothetical protein
MSQFKTSLGYISEFQASLSYISSFRPAWWNTIWLKAKQNSEEKKKKTSLEFLPQSLWLGSGIPRSCGNSVEEQPKCSTLMLPVDILTGRLSSRLDQQLSVSGF